MRPTTLAAPWAQLEISPPSEPRAARARPSLGRRRGRRVGRARRCLRRRFRVPAAVTRRGATVAGPLGLAVLRPATEARDAALFALQMWAFTVVHELPYDDPERLRRRLRVRYPIRADRASARGELPELRLQRALARPGRVDRARPRARLRPLGVVLRAAPLAGLDPRRATRHRFARAARQIAAAYDIGCAVYFAGPDGAAMVGGREQG